MKENTVKDILTQYRAQSRYRQVDLRIYLHHRLNGLILRQQQTDLWGELQTNKTKKIHKTSNEK